ncbi:unnamed protein product [Phytophthora fragariaefolia]|uniref:Unnamed protein product n=1 Tax=Phytophthora fragariaefolia TaxID=1490495 RepID=A0A9W6Y656_9STRA|nr:unnamed protein product [Phytophthora fragariaefolia]
MERSPRVRKRRPVDEGDSDTDASWGVESVESSESSDLSWRVGGSSQSEASAIGCRSSDDHSSGGNHVEISPDLDETQFDSWEAFHSYMEDVKDRNKIIDKATNPTATKNPEDFEDYAKTLICTHGGKYKYRGKEVIHIHMKTIRCIRVVSGAVGCSCLQSGAVGVSRVQSDAVGYLRGTLTNVSLMLCDQINACVRLVAKEPQKFAVCVTKTMVLHNHRMGQRTYKQYASNRLSVGDEVLSTVNVLRKAGAKAKSILKFIVEHSDSSRDVHNLVHALKLREQGTSTRAQRLKTWMMEFCEVPGNIGRIFVDSSSGKRIATCITVQTKHMVELFDRFPEVLLIDATHGTNACKYKVFSFMAHDIFGKGQYVQHAIMQNESSETLFSAIEEFKKNNSSWSKLRCVIIDKDFIEIGVLKSAFPNVRVLLCQFHVVNDEFAGVREE